MISDFPIPIGKSENRKWISKLLEFMVHCFVKTKTLYKYIPEEQDNYVMVRDGVNEELNSFFKVCLAG